MTYIGLNKVPIPVGSLGKTTRSICLILKDPGTWDTGKMLKIWWRMAGGIIDNVTLISTYRQPETKELSHTYEIVFNCKSSDSKAGHALTYKDVTKLTCDIEKEIESKMAVVVRGHHIISQKGFRDAN